MIQKFMENLQDKMHSGVLKKGPLGFVCCELSGGSS